MYVYIPGWKWPADDGDEVEAAVSLSVRVANLSALFSRIECAFNLYITQDSEP